VYKSGLFLVRKYFTTALTGTHYKIIFFTFSRGITLKFLMKNYGLQLISVKNKDAQVLTRFNMHTACPTRIYQTISQAQLCEKLSRYFL
jgi:hypothetical protein